MLRSNKEKTIHRKNALSELYNNYYCEKGVCKYYKTCSKQALADNLTAGYDSSLAAMVGENYDIEINDEKIRILIVGKEGRNKNDLQYSPKRLLGFLNEGKVNLHYRETYKMLCEMFNYNWNNDSIADSNKFLFKPDSVLTCFSLTNLYRCAFKKYPEQVKGVKNYPIQTENCLELLIEEIRILEPTIIILQKAGLHASDISRDAVELTDTLFYSETIDSYIIETIHPSNYGKWYNEAYPRFSRDVKKLRLLNKLPPEDLITTEALNKLTD